MFMRRVLFKRHISTVIAQRDTHSSCVPAAHTRGDEWLQLHSLDKSSKLFSKLASKQLVSLAELPDEHGDDGDDEAKYNTMLARLKDITQLYREKKLDGPLKLSRHSTEPLVSLALSTGHCRELYTTLLSADVDITTSQYSKLRNTLRKGSEQDRSLYEFSPMLSDDETLRLKFLTAYSFDMINQIVVRYIQLNEPMLANKYLELLISKYQLNTELRSSSPDEDSKLYETISYLTIKHGHYKYALKVLEQMSEKGITITPKLFTIIVTSLRHKKQYNAILVVLRSIPSILEECPLKVKSILINELLRVIRDEFPREAKVVLAHFVEIFPHWSTELNLLGLSGVVYLKTVRRLPEGYEVAQASVNEFYRVPNPSNENVTELYAAVLNHMAHHSTDTSYNLSLLFKRYMSRVVECFDDPASPFRKSKLDTGVLELFIKHSIRIRNPGLAFYMLKQFINRVDLPVVRFNKKLITYVFYHHGMMKDQHPVFDQMSQIMSRYKVPVDFNMLSALVFKDSENSQFWYDKLVEMGYPVQLDKLRRKAQREGWPLEELSRETSHWEDQANWMEEEDEEFVKELQQSLDKLSTA